MAERTISDLDSAYRALDEAVQVYVSETLAGGVVTDWSLSVEHTNGPTTNMLVFLSKTMTAWKLAGFAAWTFRRLNAIAQTVLDSET